MKKQVYKTNKDGFLEEIFIAYVDEGGNVLDEDKAKLISVDPPQGLFRPRWIGGKWIEGATQEEIDELTKVEPSPPTQAEILEQCLADLEIMLAEILFN